MALIWAAATITFTEGYEGLAAYMAEPGHNPSSLIHEISTGWLGTVGGLLAIIGVIAAPITTGDTALRSARLIVADFTGFSQGKLWRRALISIPLFVLTYVVMTIDFNVLWRYVKHLQFLKKFFQNREKRLRIFDFNGRKICWTIYLSKEGVNAANRKIQRFSNFLNFFASFYVQRRDFPL